MTQPQQTQYEPRTSAHCNVHRIETLANHIREVPYFNLNGKQFWIRQTFKPGEYLDDYPRERTGFNMHYFINKLEEEDPLYDEFDSVADLLGWAVILFHNMRIEEVDQEGSPVGLLMYLLNINEEQALAIGYPDADHINVGELADDIAFDPDSWTKRMRRAVKPHHAAEALERFLDGWPLDKLYNHRKETA